MEVSKRETSSASHPAASNAASPVRPGIWLRLRALLAELTAFPVHIRETDDNWVVLAELPGLRRNEVRVEVGHILVIDAEPKLQRGQPCRRAGRRLLRVPDGAEIALAKADLRAGILTVTIPMPHSRRFRHVPVECDEDFSLPIHDI
jgi:HSP20 family molecular chaperone IbpA